MAFIAVILAAMSAVILNQQKEMRALSENFAALDVQRELMTSFADGSLCTYTVARRGVSFDSTTLSPRVSKEFTFNQIQSSASASAPPLLELNAPASSFSSSLYVKSIKLKINSGSAGVYRGLWIVEFDSNRSVRALKPVLISTELNVDASEPHNSKILSCKTL
jgi:hypothetical protein